MAAHNSQPTNLSIIINDSVPRSVPDGNWDRYYDVPCYNCKLQGGTCGDFHRDKCWFCLNNPYEKLIAYPDLETLEVVRLMREISKSTTVPLSKDSLVFDNSDRSAFYARPTLPIAIHMFMVNQPCPDCRSWGKPECDGIGNCVRRTFYESQWFVTRNELMDKGATEELHQHQLHRQQRNQQQQAFEQHMYQQQLLQQQNAEQQRFQEQVRQGQITLEGGILGQRDNPQSSNSDRQRQFAQHGAGSAQPGYQGVSSHPPGGQQKP